MADRDTLRNLAIEVDKILKEELEKAKITPNFAEARVYDILTVGV